MGQRTPLVLSVTALAVAVLGTTPFGQAAGTRLAAAIPPFAKRSGFATTAANARRLNGRRSALSGGAGTIPVVGKDGKLPPALGAVGPQGPQGPQGDRGPQGAAGPAGGAGAGAGTPNGPAGGALAGSYPNPQIAANAIGGAQVVDNGLTGADVDESTLGQVPIATLGGTGRSASAHLANTPTCTPTTSFGACVDVTFALPARTRVLVLGRITGNTKGTVNGDGKCRISTSASGPLPESTVAAHVTGDTDWIHFPLLVVTPPVGPGPVTFSLDCMSYDTPLSLRYIDAAIAAVALSPS